MAEVKSLKKREEIDLKYKWKVEKIYNNTEQWESDFKSLKEEALETREYEGKLGDSKALETFLKLNEKIVRKAEKLMVYAHLRADEDTSNPEFQILRSKIDSYFAELASYVAFFEPEILALPDGTIERFLQENPELQVYDFLLKSVLKEKPHILTKEMEELLASVSDCLDAPSNIHNMLTNADMKFSVIKDEDGNDVELTEGNYSGFIRSKDRSVREAAFKALFKEYKNLENTLSASLTSSIKNFIFNARVRKYSNSLEASLSPNDIPLEVYTNSVKTMNDNLESLHRYVTLKKKLLALDEIHMYDLYVPVVDIEKEHIEYDKAVEMVTEGLNPLGVEYLGIFSEGIESGWIDVFENKGKRGGAYSSGAYDTMPYVLLNYNFSLNDVSTLAHEMGHSIHTYYSSKNQPYIYSNYTLFCAEVASTTNEIILIHHLIDKEQDKKRKLYLVNQELEQIRATVFRQLMFAEFELKTHELIEQGEALSPKELNGIWHDLNTKYFGSDMVVDEEIDSEWSRIPHFYRDFYVYQYATGYAAASAFAKAILENGEEAVEKYKGFLKSGGSDYPINVLKKAGVDMTTSAPLEATINRFNELLDMLDELI
ncbi:oligoendopeptidase F [Clostridium folliculivorans]|uniref:Oligopeptidase F n=1 Tax=Clostridium folliculivorans TaxID=2886038 RepID=A0A9W5Y319_9CLOT|nr:oligoendopeptidase F [Clostridium folliculivorans]GKU25693.1 oligoendopeptidase F [Clostridium folliculivorans]GKU28715.1 oligoendopeptidase F [Clostridium folliculivorans]